MHHAGLALLVLLTIIIWAFFGVSVAAYLIALLVGAVAGVGLAVWLVDYRSIESRVARAMRGGQVGQAVRLLVQNHQDRELGLLVVKALPHWPEAQRAVMAAAQELAALQQAVSVAGRVGVPPEIVNRLQRESQLASAALGGSADRLGAAAVQQVDSDQIQRRASQIVAKIDQLAVAANAARCGLAELSLVGAPSARLRTEEEDVHVHLVALGKAASELAALEDRPAGR